MNRSLVIACLLYCTIARGQSQFTVSAVTPTAIPSRAHALVKAAGMHRFAAASINLSPVRDPSINKIYVHSDGRIVCAHCTLRFLAMMAFDLAEWQVTGGSEWMGDAQFDLEAVTSEPAQPNARTPLTDAQRQMLRTLLKDRFRLEGHRETRTDTVYVLEKSDKATTHRLDGFGAGANVSMHELAMRISNALKRPVVDQTGLSGTFDFGCGATAKASSEFADTVFDSIQGAGLKLTPAIGQVETLVIDGAQPPEEN